MTLDLRLIIDPAHLAWEVRVNGELRVSGTILWARDDTSLEQGSREGAS
jgi:hypothetical protein